MASIEVSVSGEETPPFLMAWEVIIIGGVPSTPPAPPASQNQACLDFGGVFASTLRYLNIPGFVEQHLTNVEAKLTLTGGRA